MKIIETIISKGNTVIEKRGRVVAMHALAPEETAAVAKAREITGAPIVRIGTTAGDWACVVLENGKKLIEHTNRGLPWRRLNRLIKAQRVGDMKAIALV